MKTNKIFKIRNINIFSIVVLTLSALLSVGCSKEDAKIIPEQEDVITSKKVWRISVEATKENQNGDTKSLAANTANTIGGTINHTMNSANSSVTQEDGWEGMLPHQWEPLCSSVPSGKIEILINKRGQ